MIGKLVIVGGSVVSLSLGASYVIDPSSIGFNHMPAYVALEDDLDYEKKVSDTNTDTAVYKGKFGEKNGRHLVGMIGNRRIDNEIWWEWSFEQLKKDKVNKGRFTVADVDPTKIKVTKAYAWSSADPDRETALNTMCNKAYKADVSKIKANAQGDHEFEEDHVWKYCSFLGEKPETKQE